MTENKKVPKLRFKEFEEEWNSYKLGEIIDSLSSGKTNVKANNVIDGINPIYGSKGVIGHMNSYDYDGDYVLIARVGAYAGYIYEINGHCGVTDNTLMLKPSNELNKHFIAYYLKNYDLNRLIFGSGQPLITGKELKKIIVNLPSLNEQNRIAGFLSCVDKKIDLLNQQLIKTQDFKKGLIQQIFTQKIKFDFNKEWKIIRLKDLLECSSSKLSLNDLEDNEGEYSLYGATGVVKSIDFYEKTTPYLAIVKDGAGVGRSFLCEQNTSIVGTLQYLEPKENIILEFSYYILNTIEFRKYIVGSTIPHIYFKDYSKEKVLIPEIEEQRKITGILSTTDKKINLIQNQISQMEQFKKGLLQQMFI